MTDELFNTHQERVLFLSQLNGLCLEELLFLFIESKTGSADDVNLLPETMLEMMQDMGHELNRVYVGKLQKELF